MKTLLLSYLLFTSLVYFPATEKGQETKNYLKWPYPFDEKRIIKTDTAKTEYRVPTAGLFFVLPNAHWHKTQTPKDNPIQYIFKRDPITDAKGRSIVPAIMIWYDSAGKDQYHGDLDIYKEQKISSIMNGGLKIQKTIPSWATKDGYPLAFKKGIFYKGTYTIDGCDHILYAMYFINKKNIGCTVYMDMTKDIAPKYEPEFWITIRSLRDL